MLAGKLNNARGRLVDRLDLVESRNVHALNLLTAQNKPTTFFTLHSKVQFTGETTLRDRWTHPQVYLAPPHKFYD